MMKKLSDTLVWILIFGFLCFGVLAGCASTGNETTPQAPVPPSDSVLRVGVSTNAPPLIYRNGQIIVGLEADFAREFAQFLGKSLTFVELKWEDQIPALLEDRIDIIMSGMTVTRVRQVRIAFSRPYFRSGQMALIRNEDLVRFKTGFYAITDKLAIGAVKNTTSEYFIEQQFGKVRKILYTNSRKGVDALIKKDIDMFIHDAPIILYLASENETKGVSPLFSLLTEEYLAWGIRKDDKELLEAANNYLQSLENDGRLKSLINHWIPFTK